MDFLRVIILPILSVIGVLIITSLLTPILARLFDRLTYGLGNWLLKKFPSSGIVQRSYEEPKQRYSRIYIPKPIKNIINNVFGQLKDINQSIKKTKQTKQGAKCYKNPLGQQSQNITNDPILKSKADLSNKVIHATDSSTEGGSVNNPD